MMPQALRISAATTAHPAGTVGGDRGNGGNNNGNRGNNNGNGNNKGKNKKGKGGNDKGGGRKSSCGSYLDKEIRRDSSGAMPVLSSADLQDVSGAADWYNYFLSRVSYHDVERLAEEATRRRINWDVTRLMVELKAMYGRISDFASAANKDAEDATRQYEMFKHPQLAVMLNGTQWPVTESSAHQNWPDEYSKGNLYFGTVKLNKFFEAQKGVVGRAAFGDARACLARVRFSLTSGAFSARVTRTAPPDSGLGLNEEKFVTFRIDTEAARMYDVVVSDSESYDDYSQIELFDKLPEDCEKDGRRTAQRMNVPTLARSPGGPGRGGPGGPGRSRGAPARSRSRAGTPASRGRSRGGRPSGGRGRSTY